MVCFGVTMCALLVLSVYIAGKNKVNIGDGLAVAASGLILSMYALAFFRAMKLIWVVAAIVILVVLANVLRAKKQKGDADSKKDAVVKMLFSLFLFIASVFVVCMLASGNVFSWWDDINFWSSDAKQLFYMNGFPGKYGNVSPEFGDYPPVTSIFKWLFLQIGGNTYIEGLQFAGYYALNAVFLMPLAAKVVDYIWDSNKAIGFRVVFSVISFLAVMAFPGVFNGIIYYGTPADITMGIVYGALLLAIYEQDKCTEAFYYVRITLYTAVLLLTKSVGIEWAVFALIFYALVAKKNVKMIFAIAGSGLFYGSWLVFCLINRRVAKLTGAGIKMATSGTYTAPQNTADKAGFFWEGLWTMPMHADRNLTLDLPTAVMVLIIFAFMAFLLWKKIFDKKTGVKILVFMLVTGLLTYGIIFFAHISIFQGEDQYLDAYAMAVSVARYGFPFAFGCSYFLIGAAMQNGQEKSIPAPIAIIAGFCVFVLLTADYAGMYKHLLGYRASASEIQASNNEMVGDDGRVIVNAVLEDDSLWGKRVLVMRDGHTYHWVHDTYISKEASPVPLVYDAFMAESEDSATMTKKILEKHASYVYVEDEEGLSKDLFEPLMADGVEYKPGTIYQVVSYNEYIKLINKK
ncbi:hypothetical protein [Butyrivibrio sp. VCB2006]|uniref:hypothetical protein n=1 Tax=Butyrivibrio sp. VCB2006 TaxID=1280679 RepID=UPI0012DF9EC9|nr:hypothetical protein [Butyrivibrio sp. VCB2006]